MEGLSARLAGLAKGGVLRAGINTGNRAIVTVGAEGALTGPAPDLARALAALIGARLEVVRYTSAPKMAEDAPADLWDICFLGHDASRAHLLAWSRPYLVIEAIYATRLPLRLASVAEADRAGHVILSAKAAAYDLHLARSLKSARLLSLDGFEASLAAFRKGTGDILAGIRAVMEHRLADDPQAALMAEPFATVGQAIAVPVARAGFVPALDDFLARQAAHRP
ncbi:MAG: hypothetical protein ACK4RN_04085 [Pseudorhodobacter sp.]